MKCLSVKQPWAAMIVHGMKTVENRTWSTKFRGRFYIHASRTVDKHAMKQWETLLAPKIMSTAYSSGSIIGAVDIINVIDKDFPICEQSDATWWEQGSYGFVLRNPKLIQPHPYTGQLNFFDVNLALEV